MTESEWLTCEDPRPMLAFLQNMASVRKLRLFAAACCRRIAHLLPDERNWAAMDATEEYADGVVTVEQLAAKVVAADEAVSYAYHRRGHHFFTAASAVLFAVVPNGDALPPSWEDDLREDPTRNVCEWVAGAVGEAAQVGPNPASYELTLEIEAAERRAQCDLIRDLFHHPVRSVALDPVWRTTTVAALAARMYESRDFTAMPILADALMDAGCTDESVLTHCREPVAHVRGCWCIDACLGKS